VHPLFSSLQITTPVLAAPMSGGPTTPAMVIAAATAGGLGFVPAGYKSPEQFGADLREVRAATPAFGANLFAPNPVPVDPEAFRNYAKAIQPVADRYQLDLGAVEPFEDDDRWQDKVDLLLAEPVPVVSFTFGLPDRSVIDALRRAGSITMQTVTSDDEAVLAEEAGVDALGVQSADAGGHWGTLTPHRPPGRLPLPDLVAAVRRRTRLPLIAAGGLATSADIAEVLRSGADAVMVGTVLLRADESGASQTHQAALADGARGRPVQTRAFTGRPARGLPNEFIARYDAVAPLGYPAVHHLTSPLRKAAAAAGDPEPVNLWAGTGYAEATAEPAATILRRLATSL